MNKYWFVIVLLCSISTHAQKIVKLKDNDWKKLPVDFLQKLDNAEAYKGEDAVYIGYYERVEYQLDYTFSHEYYYSIKYLTQAGIDNDAQLTIPYYENMDLTFADARTIKKNGSIVDMNASESKNVDIVSRTNFNNKRKFIIAKIPGVEIGDVVQVHFQAHYNFGNTGNNIYIDKDYPSLQSILKVIIPSSVSTEMKYLNDIPDPKIEETSQRKFYTFEMKNLPGNSDEVGIIPVLQLPGIEIQTRTTQYNQSLAMLGALKHEEQDWKLFHRIKNYGYFGQSYPKNVETKGIKSLYTKLGIDYDKPFGIEGIWKLASYIHQNITIEKLSESEENLPVDIILSKKHIDERNLAMLFNSAFEHSGLRFKYALVRNRYNGTMDLKTPRFHQIDDWFFAYVDAKEKLHFFQPPTEKSNYFIDEMYYAYEGTRCVLIDKSDTAQVLFAFLPPSTINDNQNIQKIKSEVNIDANTVRHTVDNVESGVYSTRDRKEYIDAKKQAKLNEVIMNELKSQFEKEYSVEDAQIISVDSIYPYKLKTKFSYVQKDIITNVSDNIYAIDMSHWFALGIDKINASTRKLNYYPAYMKTTANNYFIIFDKEVELANAQNLNIKLETDEVKFEISATQINPKTISLSATYQLKKLMIEANKVSAIENAQKAYSKLNNEQLVVKIK